jgi:hypothetical protein
MVGDKAQKQKYSQGQTHYPFNFPASFIIRLFCIHFITIAVHKIICQRQRLFQKKDDLTSRVKDPKNQQ